MKKKTLLWTNLIICIILIVGFALASIISYRSNFSVYEKDAEMVSNLSSESIYNEISELFSQPLNVSLTMANDSLLKNFLVDEQKNLNNKDWLEKMKDYLNTYRDKYNYDSVFLVSHSTQRYYHFEGLNRVLDNQNKENTWYYDFVSQNDEYEINIDNDEATDNTVMVFMNCKIKDTQGKVLGVVGVGLKIDSLQTLLADYEKKYGVKVYLIDNNGTIEISSSVNGYESKNIFDVDAYKDSKNKILNNEKTQNNFWYSNGSQDSYIVTRYQPHLKWHLVVDNDISLVNEELQTQFYRNAAIIIFIIILILVIVTRVIKRYDILVRDLTISQELEYQKLLHQMTVGLYENIFELDISHNCASGESTRKYFESLGIDRNAPYDIALKVIANKQVKEEYRQGYIDTFCLEAVLKAYKNGVTNLSYDFMISKDGDDYHWMRISARIFYWKSDNSIRMITYREDIDDEKKRELMLIEGVQKDSMTGLYNKRAIEIMISNILENNSDDSIHNHAFLIIDIDNFKVINDNMGHSFGDHVINEIAAEIKTQFRESDIVGRIGGDEFVVLMKDIDDIEKIRPKIARLCNRIDHKDFGEGKELNVSCSIGIALFPQDGEIYSDLYEKADQALYYAKSHGKNSFVIFKENEDGYSFHANQRDMEKLMDTASDGLAQMACTTPLTLLYFNQKCIDLFGVPTEVLCVPSYDPFSQVHPDDVERLKTMFEAVSKEKQPFTISFRALHYDGHYFPITIKGIFISEKYKNEYPIFYIMYIKDE